MGFIIGCHHNEQWCRFLGILRSLVLDRLRNAASGFGNVGLAFAHRNYRVYVIGNSVGLIGTWLQRMSVGWLAWTLTHSGTWLGIMSMAEFFPVVFLSPLAGVLADRRDQVGVIRTTQIIGGVQAGLVVPLLFYHHNPTRGVFFRPPPPP